MQRGLRRAHAFCDGDRRAETALDDYERDKRSPDRKFNRFMLVAGFWLTAAVLLVALWRLLGL